MSHLPESTRKAAIRLEQAELKGHFGRPEGDVYCEEENVTGLDWLNRVYVAVGAGEEREAETAKAVIEFGEELGAQFSDDEKRMFIRGVMRQACCDPLEIDTVLIEAGL